MNAAPILIRPPFRPSRQKPQRWECPQSPPLLNLLGLSPGSHTLRFADLATPRLARKPDGASELQLFVAISDQPGAPVSEARFYRKFGKNPIVVEFSEADDGKVATHYGRWSSPTGETGPWSMPVSMRIAV